MSFNNFTENLLEKIKSEKIEPKARWKFLLKNYFVWLFGFLALIFGSFGVSVLIYLLKNNSWELALNMNTSFLAFLLLTLPYFWILFFSIFVFIIYYNLKHTKKGYRYPVYFIIIGAFFISIILGELFFILGFGEKIDNILGKKSHFYHEIFNPQMSFWLNPEEGRLVGLSDGINEDEFILLDFNGKAWNISLSDDIRFLGRYLPGEPIILLGELKAENYFEASLIRPMRPGGEFLRKRLFLNPDCAREGSLNCDLPPMPNCFNKECLEARNNIMIKMRGPGKAFQH